MSEQIILSSMVFTLLINYTDVGLAGVDFDFRCRCRHRTWSAAKSLVFFQVYMDALAVCEDSSRLLVSSWHWKDR